MLICSYSTYHLYVLKNVCYCVFSYATHGVCLPAACLSIRKNACWSIRHHGERSKEDINTEIPWILMMLVKEEKQTKGRNSQLMPPTTERATSLAAFSYTCLVEQSDRNTLSIAKRKAWQIRRGKQLKPIMILE